MVVTLLGSVRDNLCSSCDRDNRVTRAPWQRPVPRHQREKLPQCRCATVVASLLRGEESHDLTQQRRLGPSRRLRRESHHFHVALQLADAGSLALGGAHVAQVVDGDGRTDAGIQLSDCMQGGKKPRLQPLCGERGSGGVAGCCWRGWTDRCAAPQTPSH